VVTCSWCGNSLDGELPVDTDHIIPRARGGPDEPWNRQQLHRRCNQVKGNTITPEARTLAQAHHVTLIPDELPADWKARLWPTDPEYDSLTTDELAALILETIWDLADRIAEDPGTYVPLVMGIKAELRNSADLGLFAAIWLNPQRTSAGKIARALKMSRQAVLEHGYRGAGVFQRRIAGGEIIPG
jgi:HNH endonuclease